MKQDQRGAPPNEVGNGENPPQSDVVVPSDAEKEDTQKGAAQSSSVVPADKDLSAMCRYDGQRRRSFLKWISLYLRLQVTSLLWRTDGEGFESRVSVFR